MARDKMKALVCDAISEDFSDVSVKQIERPEPKSGEVLVRVRAASINFPDILMCQGKYQHKPELPFIVGMNFSGDVVELGPDVPEHLQSKAVAGSLRPGAFAGYVTAKANSLHRVPDGMGYAPAAAYPSVYLTAYVSLVRRANLQPGETVLVHGAAGGVGLATVDLAKILGAKVIATASTKSKMDFLRSYGADLVLGVDEGFREEVKDFTDGRGADVIFDPVGGDVFDESTRCIAFDGRLLVVGFTSGRIAKISTNIPLIKGFSVVGVRAGEYGRRNPEHSQENMDAIWQLAADGRTRPHVHAELPLEEFRTGYEMLTNREAIGKVVLTM